MNPNLIDDLFADLDLAEREAFKNLARYKFWMFGYFAARWVFLNRALKAKRPNPFSNLVNVARVQCVGYSSDDRYANIVTGSDERGLGKLVDGLRRTQ
jgi:hypothetical protein